MLEERYELAVNRIREIEQEHALAGGFDEYFTKLAGVILLILDPEETPEYNEEIYRELLPENYENSFANPSFCAKMLGKMTNSVNAQSLENTGVEGVGHSEASVDGDKNNSCHKFKTSQMLCFLYSELRGLIPYAFEYKYYKNCAELMAGYGQACGGVAAAGCEGLSVGENNKITCASKLESNKKGAFKEDTVESIKNISKTPESISGIAESYKEVLTIYLELFIEIYVLFTDAHSLGIDVKVEELHDILYWFNSDNCDIISPLRIRQQLDPQLDFALNIIENAELVDYSVPGHQSAECCSNNNSNDNNDNVIKDDGITKTNYLSGSGGGTGQEYYPFYLYKYGEYITDNEIEVAKFLAKMPQSEIDAMASTYTEGYRIGFVKAGKPLDKKRTVNIRYNLGFERVIKAAIKNFRKMGLEPVIYRAASLSLDKKGVNKIGYLGAIPNKQYDYDHREDQALYLTKDFVNRKTLVIKTAYEENKLLANTHAGPAVMEVYGELPFSPEVNSESITLDVVGRKNQVDITDRLGQLTNEYIKGDERSYTIISYPIPEIGEKFPEIFSETVKLNTLDYTCYESMQQVIIDVLDTADEVRIEGSGTNRTRLTVKTQKITDATKQTSFENCVADVNIPVGEVFTSPVLKGTSGVLNVSEVYLFGLNYIDLTLTFKDGMITDYNCGNFESEEENKKYIRENLLHNHETLPLGEFAIGTNTTAYRMARDYHIEDRMPILIGEKTGPHFAIGDTCYLYEEDVKVYNPDGKEIIARGNELTDRYRKTEPGKAYFNCHTDITIPYDELKGIYAVHPDRSETAIIEDGRFVLPGLEELNKPLERD